MRIAIFHELPQGSGSRKSVDFIAALLSENNSVDLYYTDTMPSYQKINLPYKTHFYKFVPVVWNGNNPKARLYRDTIELLKLFFLHKKIASIMRNKKYDAIFINGSYLTESPFLLLFRNTLKIYYAHAPNYTLMFEKVMGVPKPDTFRYIYELANRAIRRIIDKKNVRSADVILANSVYTKNKIASFYGKKSKVSYLGVDTRVYKPVNLKKKYDFLFIGSYHPVDGYNLIIQALKLFGKKPSFKIQAIEDGWIESNREMVRLYNQSKIVLCLSHGEPFGLVAIEAMACGVPVIAVDEAGYRETVIHGKTGLLIKRNPEDLAKAIKKIIRNSSKLKTFSKNARKEAVRKWSWEKAAKKMEKIIQREVLNYEL